MSLDNKVVPVDFLRTQFDYDPKTGKIVNAPTRRQAKAGADPTYPVPRGYLAVKVSYKKVRYTFMAHRLGWALHTGKHPVDEVDHENTERKFNAFHNLREATGVQNRANRACSPARDLPQGVTHTPKVSAKKPFTARITVNGRCKHLGCYPDAESAGAAYAAEHQRVYGQFSRTG